MYHGDVGSKLHGIVGPQDVEVSFVIEYVVVHGAAEVVVNLVAVFLVVRIVGTLNVA